MQMMVPTVMCEAIVAQTHEAAGKAIKAGEIVKLPYGHALQLRALGLVGGFKDEDMIHLEATEKLAIYGGDCWFPQRQQTISRVAEFLAQTGVQTATPN